RHHGLCRSRRAARPVAVAPRHRPLRLVPAVQRHRRRSGARGCCPSGEGASPAARRPRNAAAALSRASDPSPGPRPAPADLELTHGRPAPSPAAAPARPCAYARPARPGFQQVYVMKPYFGAAPALVTLVASAMGTPALAADTPSKDSQDSKDIQQVVITS